MTKRLLGEVQKVMGWKQGSYMFTNPCMVLIQECEPWMGYEAAHRT